MQEKSRLTTAVSIVSLLTAAVAVGISAKLLPSVAFWAAAIGILAVAGAFVWPPLRAWLSARQTRRHSIRVAKLFRTRTMALASILAEITSSALDSRSVGSILNTAHTYKALDGYAVNAHTAHLSTLGGWTKCIQKRAINGNLSGTALLSELFDAIREYLRLCDLVAGEIESHSCDSVIAYQAIVNAWTQIGRQANSVADEFVAISRAVNLEDHQANLPVYLSPARDLNLMAKSTGFGTAPAAELRTVQTTEKELAE